MKLGRPGQIYQAFFFTPASLSLSLTLSSLPPQFFQPILISIYYLYRSPRFFALLSEFSPSMSPSLLLRMLTYHSPHSTSFMNLSPIMYPVVRLIYILMVRDHYYRSRQYRVFLSEEKGHACLDQRNIWNSTRGEKKLEMVAEVTTRRVIWAAYRACKNVRKAEKCCLSGNLGQEMGNKWFVNGNWKRNETREWCNKVRRNNKTIFS